tara:strand:+ start:2042 stop:2461 length:420 start_codon:yes stop_codon:yes gene_type:complete
MDIKFMSLVMSALIVLGSLTGILVFMGDVVTSYPETSNPSPEDLELAEFGQRLQEQLGVTEQTQFQTDPTAIDSAVMLISSGWTAITTLITMPITMTSALGHAISLIPFIPPWVSGILAALIMASFIFFIIYLVFKVKG